MNVWWGWKAGVLLMLSFLGSFEGDPIRQCIQFFLHLVGFRKGRSQLRLDSQLRFGSGPRSENFFRRFSIPRAIAWHLGWKVYNMITKNAGNQATIFWCRSKILCFTFEYCADATCAQLLARNQFAFKMGHQGLHILVEVTVESRDWTSGFLDGNPIKHLLVCF